jgi:hypothetical protein
MFESQDIPRRLVTKDEALAVIIAWTAAEAEFNASKQLAELSFETTIVAWLSVFELLDVRKLAQSLNILFDVRFCDATWERILKPMKERTVGDVCDVLARHAQVTCVLPVTVMGDTSLAAGAFLAVRQVLARSGVDVSNLRPSSEIAPVLRTIPHRAMGELMRLAPGRLPTVQVDAPVHGVCAGVFFGSLLVQRLLSYFPAAGSARVSCIVLCVFSFFAMLLVGKFLKPRRVQFAWTHTFKDLARVIIGQRCPTGHGFALD